MSGCAGSLNHARERNPRGVSPSDKIVPPCAVRDTLAAVFYLSDKCDSFWTQGFSNVTSALSLAIIGAGKIARDQHLPAIAGSDALSLAAVVDPAKPDLGVPSFASL